jgi:small-conductance mechanosensitive channel
MDTFLTLVTLHIEGWMAAWLGPRGAVPIAGAVTWTDAAVSALYLSVAVLCNAAGALFIRRRSQPASPVHPTETRHRVFFALGKPLYFLIWIYGIYVAATPVLLELKPDEGLLLVRRTMDLGFDLGALAALFLFLFRATHVLQARVAAWAARTATQVDDLLIPLLGSALRVVIIVVGVNLGLPLLHLAARWSDALAKLTSILLIGAVATLCFRSVSLFQRVMFTRYDMTAADNLRARQIYTQMHVIGRVLYVIIGFFTVASILMLFEEVRHVGASLLASAGVVGIIAGFAAQKTLANLFAGFQIALAQPVRQDDVVVVEGEWGRIEEITLTFVIVHIWDDRRLVLPLSYFIEKPFQNWTRTSAQILGSVLLWMDYSFPVAEAREALKDIVEQSPLWDKRFWNLQVSDASDTTIQLRVLATSADSSKSWDLRCEIREKFVAYIQANHPSALPQVRAQVPPVSPMQQPS